MTVGDDGSGAVYSGEPITRPEDLQAVRELPGMYVGDVHDGTGLHSMLEIVAAQAVDAHLRGRCGRADFTLRAGGEVEMRCDAPGGAFDDPGDVDHPGQVAFTSLGAAIHPDSRLSDFRYGRGPLGSMLMSVNAVSERMTADFSREGRRWHLAFERGLTLEASSTAEAGAAETVLCFKPDATIFTRTYFDPEAVENTLRALSFVLRGMAFTLRDEVRGGDEQRFHAEGGLADDVRRVADGGAALLGPPIVVSAESPDQHGPWMKVELALQWRRSFFEEVKGYTNGVYNRDGGTHLSGLRRAVRDCLSVYAVEAGLLAGDRTLSGDDARTGLVAVVSLWHCQARYTSSTRHRLTSTEAIAFVQAAVNRQLFAWLRAHPDEARAIVSFVLDPEAHIPAG